MSSARVACAIAGCFATLMTRANPVLAGVFSDHAVLQRDRDIPVWGTAAPGEKLDVVLGTQKASVKADADGRWRVRFPPRQASFEPIDLTVRGASVVTVRNLLVGEVWLCAGQSNMARPVRNQRGRKPIPNAAEELQNADRPHLRLFKVARAHKDVPARTGGGSWVVCTPENLGSSAFSAVGYFFGCELQRELNVPVGLIDASVGSTRIEAWTNPDGFEAVASLPHFARAARVPGTAMEGIVPGTLYNGMVHPIVPFAMRGVIWYQGENNLHDVCDVDSYGDKMKALILGWRTAWANPELAFHYVQLAPYLYHVVAPQKIASSLALPRFREAQERALKLPGTGMVVTTDLVEDLMDIHPPRKKEVGQRLALVALARTYGRNDVVACGPVFRSAKVLKNEVIVRFDCVAAGLASRDGSPLTWFTLAGADGEFHPAEAVIADGAVVVSSPKVKAPARLRFGWDEAARPNLCNSAGLPARPFQADLPIARSSVERP